jgi:hypothetical protein
MKRAILMLAVVFCVSNCTHAQITASTPPIHGKWYKIRVVQAGKYLAVEGGSTANGARIVLWDDANQKNHKFLAQKNDDGTYSFFAGHSNKSICAEKGDNREGDVIVQNTLSQYFGKWQVTWMNTCGMGFKITYKSGGGRPIQVANHNNGVVCQLIQPIYQDGAEDCPYLFLFEPVEAPAPVIEKPVPSETRKTPQVIKKNGNR